MAISLNLPGFMAKFKDYAAIAISLSAVAKYQGIQREYAICLRKLQIMVNAAAEKSDNLKKSRDRLLQEISERESILKDGARYIELNKINKPCSLS